ncbi:MULTISPECIES: bifunctional hydroxymethylpyrimidine kinase/phosphomethylpyrimidine kinase [unclassified Limnohabitans]|jgi:hydroxymethylpyrimidine/phosphomethylpyrimidine kinase|uniref:bifunctional hydroxymethylpyrimidine kinase/phosphomethylpyrimidine kinase n=1 Tax=unclassified Limnohabitans TaxID=2626134 RepID=UPI0006DBFE34|nr:MULTISPECIES: bifunctional hydroxymethylpyrimidine kinase/phosphomethylpyrimidine kinase [unclassified Limnohabitans]ALK92941.1 Hydroxymethylpyrimidine/phosphomethylpyrimidine kinase [Limnohabitans sp. 103DPR2]MBU3722206.1 hydroxymethylpyrimidine/phosphomethylpyrimidine kinase [Limnohabitans sp.]PUE36242.1 hydroxymethylpyrimidine/phosphomethylpyrimidine kinase [Limnohabitans sp. Hippo4]
MTTSLPPSDAPDLANDSEDDASIACVLVFNASDPSGASGISADVLAIASVGAHALPVLTGAYAKDTAQTFDFFPLPEEAVGDQARAILEDVPPQVIKVGFAGSAENISIIAELTADYDGVPVVAYMPNLSWWEDDQIDQYLDAFRELLLPQTSVLVGHHSTLRRWLLPDWSSEKNPGPRDIAKAASELGVPYTLVTGLTASDQHIDNVLATPETVVGHEKFERIEAVFSGAGETLSAALAALIATGLDLSVAASEALHYLDRCLDEGFRPGMGHVIPDRLFWALPESEEGEEGDEGGPDMNADFFEMPINETKH